MSKYHTVIKSGCVVHGTGVPPGRNGARDVGVRAGLRRRQPIERAQLRLTRNTGDKMRIEENVSVAIITYSAARCSARLKPVHPAAGESLTTSPPDSKETEEYAL